MDELCLYTNCLMHELFYARTVFYAPFVFDARIVFDARTVFVHFCSSVVRRQF